MEAWFTALGLFVAAVVVLFVLVGFGLILRAILTED